MISAKQRLITLGQPSPHVPHPPPHHYHHTSGVPSKSAITGMPPQPSKSPSATPSMVGTQTTFAKAQTTKPIVTALGDPPTQQNTSSLSAPYSPITAESSSAIIPISGSSPQNRAAMPLPNSFTIPNNFSGPYLPVPTPHDSVCIPVLGTDLSLLSHCSGMDCINFICSVLRLPNMTLSP